MNHDTDILHEAKRLRLLAAALELQHFTSTESNIVPIPGGDRVIAIGTPAEVRALLGDASSNAASIDLDKTLNQAGTTARLGSEKHCRGLLLEIEAAYELARRSITANEPGKCEDCDGRGHDGDFQWQGHFQPPEPGICNSCGGSGKAEASGSDGTAAAVLAARAEGRAEAVEILSDLCPETGIDDYIGWSNPVGPEDEGSSYWKLDKLRELFKCDDKLHNLFDRAESMYWRAKGEKDEAEREMQMVRRAPFYQPLHDFLSKHQAYDLMGDLKRAATSESELAPDERALVEYLMLNFSIGEANAQGHAANLRALAQQAATCQPAELTGQAAGAVCQPLADLLPEPRKPHSSEPRDQAHAAGWNACLEAVRAALAQQAVAPIGEIVQGGRCALVPVRFNGPQPPVGTKLYASPSPSAEEDQDAKDVAPLTHCAAGRDGECGHAQCPQLRDGEPAKSGRHCPLDAAGDEA